MRVVVNVNKFGDGFDSCIWTGERYGSEPIATGLASFSDRDEANTIDNFSYRSCFTSNRSPKGSSSCMSIWPHGFGTSRSLSAIATISRRLFECGTAPIFPSSAGGVSQALLVSAAAAIGQASIGPVRSHKIDHHRTERRNLLDSFVLGSGAWLERWRFMVPILRRPSPWV